MRFVSALLVSAAILLSGLPAVAQISSEAMIPDSVDVAGDWEVVENRAWTLAELGGLESLSGWRRVWESDSRTWQSAISAVFRRAAIEPPILVGRTELLATMVGLP